MTFGIVAGRINGLTLGSWKGESTLDWVNSLALTEEITTIDGIVYDKQSQLYHQRKLSVIKGWKGKWLVSRKEGEDIFPRKSKLVHSLHVSESWEIASRNLAK